MAKQRLVTLLTDFGTRDPYVAAMKGVILSACPHAQVVDISHDIPPQDVLAAAVVLAQATRYFPPDTLHVVVVDPSVGTNRRILAGRFGGQVFLFPDNGVITFVAESTPAEALVSVSNTTYLPPRPPSMTFHGRDIFAPVAGHILNGVPLSRLGPQPQKYELLDIPAPAERQGGLVGEVIYVDRFGNMVSNVSDEALGRWCKDPAAVRVVCAGRNVGPLQGTYAFAGVGEPLALFNSMGLLEVAVNRGRACDVLRAGVGCEVRLLQV
ncbi:MAG TPA: SAM-dependent chlorinase/fluorinase [Phycisphaerae bacterium]|nr:SAM-dependent chlorinase/fluorinase [Phycisphaerae bacterium]